MNIKPFLLKTVSLLLISTFIYSQKKPKLVVGIVVDQMRIDYLERFSDKYTENGFKRLMNEGFQCKNNQYHYASTVTGPGHAHVYTGSSPALSGIVGNGWYDRQEDKKYYVVEDSTVSTVGDGSKNAGKMSPKNMKVTTITDQLLINNQFNSKVIGLAIKDRGAILPAGHAGDAYWLDGSSGNWITSTFYREALPQWVINFNNQKWPETYASRDWEPVLSLDNYYESEDDDQPYENPLSGEEKAVFPHKFSARGIAGTPFGNDLTLKISLEALKGEKLGQGDLTDFLAISFSSPDYVGHAFGPQSKEVEDVYIRLDRNIEELLNTLDKYVGVGEYTVFLSADHGVAEIPAFLRKNKINAGILFGGELKKKANDAIVEKYGEADWILSSDNYQLYLNRELLIEKDISTYDITELLKYKFLKEEGIYNVVDLTNLTRETIPQPFKDMIASIYNPKRSGEIMFLVEPAWFSGYNKGTTHGTMYHYDTHVPLLFFGAGVNTGSTVKRTNISDIAPTLAAILGILEPNGVLGNPIEEVIAK